jgi:hypothetical protein
MPSNLDSRSGLSVIEQTEVMMNETIRRQRKNYLLPTEALPIFRQMVGVSIAKFKTGTRCTSAEDIAKERAQYKAWGLPVEFHGQPYFLTIENGKTIAFTTMNF